MLSENEALEPQFASIIEQHISLIFRKCLLFDGWFTTDYHQEPFFFVLGFAPFFPRFT